MFLGTFQRQSQRRYFSCITYREFGKGKCTMHSTSYKDLYALVLNDIQQYAKLALEKSDALLHVLSAESDKKKQNAMKQTRNDYEQAKKRLGDLDNLLQKLFEENAVGNMNASNYNKLFQKYQKEQEKLEIKVVELEKQVACIDKASDNSQRFLELITKYADLQELDAPIINELCEKILIHQAEKIDGKRVQKIEIVYRFIGKIPVGQ
jgi:hypothetical protein